MGRLCKRAGIVAAAIIGVLAIGACSADQSSGHTGTGSQTRSPRSARSARLTHGPAPVPGNRPDTRLEPALLRASDLGRSFVVAEKSNGSGGRSGSASVRAIGCPPMVKMLSPSAGSGHVSRGSARVSSASVVFTAGQAGPFVTEGLTASPMAVADSVYAQWRAALASCHSLGFVEAGHTVPFKLRPINLGGPPGSAAVRMDDVFGGVEVNGYLAVDRIKDVIQTYFFYQFRSRSSRFARSSYVKAVERLKAFCQAPRGAVCSAS